MLKTMNIGIDHGYYAIETRHFSFLAGIAVFTAMNPTPCKTRWNTASPMPRPAAVWSSA